MKTESGFTLLEIIVSLMLVGIITAMAGMAILMAAKGFMFTRENAHMAQKAQLAMARMERELLELLDVGTTSSTSIEYTSTSGTRKMGLHNGKIKIAEGSTLLSNGDVLIDQVSGYTLTYSPTTISPTTIQVDLSLRRTESGVGDITFSTTVHPRNK